jgi:hypothetical protein
MLYIGFVMSDGRQLLNVGCHGEMSAAVVTRCNYTKLAREKKKHSFRKVKEHVFSSVNVQSVPFLSKASLAFDETNKWRAVNFKHSS